MYAIELVKYLTETAGELLDGVAADAVRKERADEAAELLNLGSRILSRADARYVQVETVIQEAA